MAWKKIPLWFWGVALIGGGAFAGALGGKKDSRKWQVSSRR